MVRGVGICENEVLRAAAPAFFLVDDRLAQFDAFAADVNVARPFDQGADVAVALAAEGTIGVAIAAGVAGRLSPPCPSARVFRRHAVSLFRLPAGLAGGASVGRDCLRMAVAGQPLRCERGSGREDCRGKVAARSRRKVCLETGSDRFSFSEFYGAAQSSARTIRRQFTRNKHRRAAGRCRRAVVSGRRPDRARLVSRPRERVRPAGPWIFAVLRRGSRGDV